MGSRNRAQGILSLRDLYQGSLPVTQSGFAPTGRNRGTKRLVSVNICSVEGNSAAIFVSKVSPGIFVIKEK